MILEFFKNSSVVYFFDSIRTGKVDVPNKNARYLRPLFHFAAFFLCVLFIISDQAVEQAVTEATHFTGAPIFQKLFSLGWARTTNLSINSRTR